MVYSYKSVCRDIQMKNREVGLTLKSTSISTGETKNRMGTAVGSVVNCLRRRSQQYNNFYLLQEIGGEVFSESI
jgi:hypothetical protein